MAQLAEKQSVTTLRPREAALKYGISAAEDVELLQIILRTGTVNQSLPQLAQSLLTTYDNLAFLSLASIESLTQFSGIGLTKIGRASCRERV